MNRRNVTAQVDSAVNPCRKFFVLEVQGRLIAAALEILGMGTLNDKPATNKFPEGLIHESKAKQKLYLRKIASMVVGKNVIQNKQMESFLAKVLSIEGYQAEIAREQREDGRFVCRFPGCDKSFTFNGKRMRDHEAQHDSQVLETEASNTTEVKAQESET